MVSSVDTSKTGTVLSPKEAELVAFVPTVPTSTEIQFARAALEQAFRLPAYTPPVVPAWQRTGAVVAATLASLFLTSEGELNVAKAQGKVPGYVGLRNLQDASSAMDRMGWRGIDEHWTADQRGRFIMAASSLYRGFERGTLSADALKTFMQELRDRIEGRQPQGVPEAGVPVRTPPNTRQPLPTPDYRPVETLAPLPTPQTTPRTRVEPRAPSGADINRELGRENDTRTRSEAEKSRAQNQAEIDAAFSGARRQIGSLQATVSNKGTFTVAPTPRVPAPTYKDLDGDGNADIYDVQGVYDTVSGAYNKGVKASFNANSAAAGRGDVQVTFSWSLPGSYVSVPVTYRGPVSQVLKLYSAGIVTTLDLEKAGIKGRVEKEQDRQLNEPINIPTTTVPTTPPSTVKAPVQNSVNVLISRGASFSFSSDAVQTVESSISTVLFYSGNPTKENLEAAKKAVQSARKALIEIGKGQLSDADRALAKELSAEFEKLAKQFKLPAVTASTTPRQSSVAPALDPYEEAWEKFKKTYHDSVEEVERTLQGSPYSGADVMRYADKRNVPVVEAARRLVDSGLAFGGTPPRIVNGNSVASSPERRPQVVVLGRGSEEDVGYSVGTAQDPRNAVSRRHAQLKTTDQGTTIEDLGTTNGTWVNGSDVRGKGPVTLRPFDEVILGNPNDLKNSYKFVYTPPAVQTQLAKNPFMNGEKYPSLQSLELEGQRIGRALSSATSAADRQALSNSLKNVIQAELARFRADLQKNGTLEPIIRAYSNLDKASSGPLNSVQPQQSTTTSNSRYESNRAAARTITKEQYGELGRYDGNDGKPFSANYVDKMQAGRTDFDQRFWQGTGPITYEQFLDINTSGHKISDYKSDQPGEIRSPDEIAIANRPAAAEYTEKVFQRYANLNLGDIPDGALSMEGIPEWASPYSVSTGETRGRHMYPRGNSLKLYFEQGAKVLSEIREGIQSGRDAAEVQKLIGKYYYVMVNARPFQEVNNAMYMNQVNYLLKLTGHPGLRNQGDLDHLFMRVNSGQADKLWGEVLKGNFPNSRDLGVKDLK